MRSVNEQARIVATKWGFDGYVKCVYYHIYLMADATKAGETGLLENLKTIFPKYGPVASLVDPTPDKSIISGAIKVFAAEHRFDSPQTVVSNVTRCTTDLSEAQMI